MLMNEASHRGIPKVAIERWRTLGTYSHSIYINEEIYSGMRLGSGLPKKYSQQIVLICVESDCEGY